MAASASSRLAGAALLAQAALYAAWFRDDRHLLASLLVFALPPLLLAWPVWRGRARAAFWAGVLALFWFSHGVMVAWAHPAQRAWAWGGIVLALAALLAACWPGVRARSGTRGR